MSDEEKNILQNGTTQEKKMLYTKRTTNHLKSIKTNVRIILIIIIVILISIYLQLNKIDHFIEQFQNNILK